MTVVLRDRVFTNTGGVVQNATVQAILVTGAGTDAGTGSVVQATTFTDANGVWKFAALPDPGVGNWYDVKITNGSQVIWRYGNIQAVIAALQVGNIVWVAPHFTSPVVDSGGLVVAGNSTFTGTLGGLTGLTVASGGLTVSSGNSQLSGSTGFGGAAALTNRVQVNGLGASSSTAALHVQNSSGTTLLQARDDGFVILGGGSKWFDAAGNLNARNVNPSDGTNGLVGAGNGNLYLRPADSSHAVVMDVGTGLQVNAGSIVIGAAGQILQLGGGGPYWQNVGPGTMQTAHPLGTNSNFSAGGNIAATGNLTVGSKSFVGTLPMLANHAATSKWRLDSGGLFVNAANGGPTPTSTNFSNTFTNPPVVVATMNGVSGGDGTNGLQLTIRGINNSGFIATVYNTSGSSQSMTINWMAFGD